MRTACCAGTVLGTGLRAAATDGSHHCDFGNFSSAVTAKTRPFLLLGSQVHLVLEVLKGAEDVGFWHVRNGQTITRREEIKQNDAPCGALSTGLQLVAGLTSYDSACQKKLNWPMMG